MARTRAQSQKPASDLYLVSQHAMSNSPATYTASSLSSPSSAARRTNSLRQSRTNLALDGHCQRCAYSSRRRTEALSQESSFTWPLRHKRKKVDLSVNVP